MNNTKVSGQIRHLLSAVGGALVALGYMAADDVMAWLNTFDQVAGPIMLIGAAIWSWISPEKN